MSEQTNPDEVKRHRQPGAWKGKVWIAPDFDETPQEWLDALEEPVDPDERTPKNLS